MHADLTLNEVKKEWHGSLKSYLIGFTLSLFLTLLSFGLVMANVFSVTHLIYTVVCLGLLQATVQLLFFLHLGKEAKPRWETIVFFFMLLILLIIAIGSLWIMHDLDKRAMADMHSQSQTMKKMK